MNHPDQSPKLPLWLFLVTDAALLGAAWYVAEHSHKPMAGNTAFTIVGCVVAGAIVALVPVVARYERRKNEVLDQRQRELEALGRTISTSAEQISIAANGFNEITDLAHKNLKQAELLPHRLQEKVAEFNAQLENAREDDREELEKELAELRASETERLQIISDKVHKAVLELSKLDATAQTRLTSHTESIERASASLNKAQSTAMAVSEAATSATRQLAAAQAKALAAIERKLSEATATAVAAIAAAATNAKATLTAAAVVPPTSPIERTTIPPVRESASEFTTTVESPETSLPPKRPRKTRHEETAEPPVMPAVSESATGVASDHAPLPPPELSVPPTTEPVPPPALSPTNGVVSETPSASDQSAMPPEQVVAVLGLIDEAAAIPSNVEGPSAQPASSPIGVPEVQPTDRPQRKRSQKKSTPEPLADLTLELSTEEFSSPSYDDAAASASDVSERVISSDGATRLIATAYIGIGNRLFVRGNGPGLSWEKGVPLQFVSIGKWRWETAEAGAPVTMKLFKNDEIECASLGEITLDPGYQQEVTARF